MRRQTLLIRYEPQATPPAGDPPSFDVTSGPGTVTLLEGDDTGVPTEASYQTHVTMTGETTFLEDGDSPWTAAACGWKRSAPEPSNPPPKRARCEAR